MEKITRPVNGFLALLISLLLMAGGIYLMVQGVNNQQPVMIGIAVATLTLVCFIWKGLMIIQPNQARVLTFFGRYIGSVKENGLFFINPLYGTQKITLRVQNHATPTLKVNDKMGNPIEIAAVITWQVTDTYRAMFDVDNYQSYMRTQSEAAVRHLATTFAYDHMEGETEALTLRAGGDEVARLMEEELNARLMVGGIKVQEARMSHLAYAPEIAGAMLQRQQATAIVAARYKIVEGAVGMVELALEQLNSKDIVNLDEEKKATMVSNLMVVLCGEKGAQPVINTGSLYQ